MSYVAVKRVRFWGAVYWAIHCPSCGHTGPRRTTNERAAAEARTHHCKGTTSSTTRKGPSLGLRASEM